jgi:acetoacetyl-CoA reductase
VLDAFGVADVLVDIAGIVRDATFAKMSKSDWDAVLHTDHGFTKALAREIARHGVTVNTVSPGYLATAMVEAVPKEIMDTKILPQIPVGRLGQPAEIAALIGFLCSGEAGFITGADLAINGGMHMQ